MAAGTGAPAAAARTASARAANGGSAARFAEVQEKALAGVRISPEEGLFLLTEAPLHPLGAAARELRNRKTTPGRVTFVVDTNPNYTNVCDADCSFCAFYRKPGDAEGYRHSVEEMVAIVARAVEAGATTLLLQGGLNDEIPFDYYLSLIAAFRERFPGLHLHLWSAPEIGKMAEVSGLTTRDVLAKLKDAGQPSLPGGGAELLTERVRRRISPKKQSHEDWLRIHREAHEVGMRSTATLMYGHMETDEDVVEHLGRLRELQDDTRGFTAFIPWSFKPGNTLLEKWIHEEQGPTRYLRMLAASRLYLDNFDHIQASWFSEGKATGQIALHYGADDFGGTLIHENVLKAADFHNTTTTEETIALIREAGFTPVQRTTAYEILARGSPSAAAAAAGWKERLLSGGAVAVAAGLTLLSGLAGVFGRVASRLPAAHEITGLLTPVWHARTRSAVVVMGLLLVYLSFNLLGRKRVAHLLAVLLSLLTIAVHLLHGPDWRASALPAVTLGLLAVRRGDFRVRSEPRSVLAGAGLAVAALVVAVAYGTAGFWFLERRDFRQEFHLGEAVLRSLRQTALLGNPDLLPRTAHARWFLESLQAIGAAAAALTALSLFRPLTYRLATLPHERAAASDILAVHGRSPLDAFKLWPDKSYLFAESGRSFVAYRAALGVAVALGDPAGPEEELEGLSRSFVGYCAERGWAVAFHQVLPDLLPMYARLGFDAIQIGEEAIVDLARFREKTAEENKELRRIRKKLEKDGLVAARTAPPIAAALLDELQEVSDEWLTIEGRRERSFTLGRFDRRYLAATPVTTVRDGEGRLLAFANEVRSYRAGDATLDLMRHRNDVPNGTMDLLFIRMMLILADEGYRTFSLGMAPLSGVGASPGAPLAERALSMVSDRLNRFFSFKGLKHYKAKFEPDWESRHLVYQGGPAGLVRTALALTRITEG